MEMDDLKEQYEAREKELKNEKMKLNAQITEFTEELRQLREVCEEQRTTSDLLDSLILERDNLNKSLDDLKADLNDKKAKLENLSEKNKNYEIELKRSNDLTMDYKVKVEQVVSKLNYLLANPKAVQPYRTKKEPVENESNKQVKQLEKEIFIYKSNLDISRNEISELKNECQLWREKFTDLEQDIEKKNNIIVYLKNRMGKTTDEDSTSEESDKQTVLATSLQGKIEVLEKDKGRDKITWTPYFAVLHPFKMEIYQNKTDTSPVQTFELRNVNCVKEITQADSVHIDKSLLPQMLQIIYSKPDTEDNRRLSVMPLDNSLRNKGSMMSIDDSNASMPSSNQNLAGIINIQNHSFVHVKSSWIAQFCDICHHPCSEMFSSSMILECTKCKQHTHSEHINDKKFPACQEAMENMSIKLESTEARMVWLMRFRKLKQYQDSEET